jgi:GT2 family glycosyltransferase
MSTTYSCDLSIVIISWNCKDFLIGCLKSIFNKDSSFSYEVIVVDNASEDNSIQVVQTDFPSVRVIRNDENLGFASANNIGITASMGRYVCLINADVIVMNDCLEILYSFMEENRSAGVAGPKLFYPDMTLQCTCRKFPSLWNNFCSAAGLNKVFEKWSFFSSEQMFYFKHDELSQVDAIAGCFMIIRREAIDQVGLLDERFFFYAEDIDWCKRFWTGGWQIYFVPSANAIHYGGGSSSNSPTRFIIEQQRAIIQYWKKHRSFLSVFLLIMILFFQSLFRITYNIMISLIDVTNKKNALSLAQKNAACLKSLFIQYINIRT